MGIRVPGILAPFAAFVFVLTSSAFAEVSVHHDVFHTQALSGRKQQVAPGSWSAIPLSTSAPGQIIAEVDVESPALSNNGSAYICSENDLIAFKSGRSNGCRGAKVFISTARLSFQANRAGTYYLLLDNRISIFTSRIFTSTVYVPSRLPRDFLFGLQEGFTELERYIQLAFLLPEFDITFTSCGFENAFSEYETGNITICLEFIYTAMEDQIGGVVLSTFFHELGHTALNLWGLPNFANEETVDEFSTYMMMRFGFEQLLSDAVSYWVRQDSWQEAEGIIRHGGTHPISAQRARNIVRNLQSGKDFTTRWNRLVYPNMTDWELRRIMCEPSYYDDSRLANQILLSR